MDDLNAALMDDIRAWTRRYISGLPAPVSSLGPLDADEVVRPWRWGGVAPPHPYTTYDAQHQMLRANAPSLGGTYSVEMPEMSGLTMRALLPGGGGTQVLPMGGGGTQVLPRGGGGTQVLPMGGGGTQVLPELTPAAESAAASEGGSMIHGRVPGRLLGGVLGSLGLGYGLHQLGRRYPSVTAGMKAVEPVVSGLDTAVRYLNPATGLSSVAGQFNPELDTYGRGQQALGALVGQGEQLLDRAVDPVLDYVPPAVTGTMEAGPRAQAIMQANQGSLIHGTDEGAAIQAAKQVFAQAHAAVAAGNHDAYTALVIDLTRKLLSSGYSPEEVAQVYNRVAPAGNWKAPERTARSMGLSY